MFYVYVCVFALAGVGFTKPTAVVLRVSPGTLRIGIYRGRTRARFTFSLGLVPRNGVETQGTNSSVQIQRLARVPRVMTVCSYPTDTVRRLPCEFCDGCTTVPYTSVSSVAHTVPHRDYPPVLYTIPLHFCKFCDGSATIPYTSVSFVTVAPQYPTLLRSFVAHPIPHRDYPPVLYTRIQHFCEFCGGHATILYTSVSSVAHPVPYRDYPLVLYQMQYPTDITRTLKNLSYIYHIIVNVALPYTNCATSTTCIPRLFSSVLSRPPSLHLPLILHVPVYFFLY